MLATLVTEVNQDKFLQALPQGLYAASDLMIGAVEEETDTACGILSCELTGPDIISVRYLYVEEEYRCMGAASAMLRMLLDIASETDIHTVTADITLLYEEDDAQDKEGLRVLFDDFGFDETSEGRIFAASLIDAHKAGEDKGFRLSLKEIGEEDWKQFIEWSAAAFSLNGSEPQEYDNACSFLSFTKKKKCNGAILVKMLGDTPYVRSILAEADDAGDVAALLLHASLRELRERNAEDRVVYFRVEDPLTEQALYAAFGNAVTKEGEVFREEFTVV